MTDLPCASATSLPPGRRGRLRNGATPGDFLAAPRCGAHTRSGECCRQPAMKNGRCRMHGGLSTGPRTAEGRARCASARRTHGFYAADTIALRRAAAAHCRRMDAFFASVKVRSTAGHGLLTPNPSNRGDAKAPRRIEGQRQSWQSALFEPGELRRQCIERAALDLTASVPLRETPARGPSRPARWPPARVR